MEHLCICQHCACKADCEFFENCVEPVANVIAANPLEAADPFIGRLFEALEKFTCDYYEGE